MLKEMQNSSSGSSKEPRPKRNVSRRSVGSSASEHEESDDENQQPGRASTSTSAEMPVAADKEEEEEEDEYVMEMDEYQTQLDQVVDRNVYDPHQDEDEKRRLRREYRSLIQDTENKRQDLVQSAENNDLVARIQKADELYGSVRNTNDATLDSRFLMFAADLGAQRSKSMKSHTFDLQLFLSRVNRFIGVESGDLTEGQDEEVHPQWNLLAELSSSYLMTAPRLRFLAGPLMADQEKKAAQKPKAPRAPRPTQEDLIKPEELTVKDIQKSENETTKNIENVYNRLREVEPVRFWQFVTNPESFSQTVENVFYCAFLVKDKRVGLDLADEEGHSVPDGLLFTLGDLEELKEEGAPAFQQMVSLDMKGWRNMIEKYQLTESLLPTRPPAQGLQNGAKWY